MDEKVIRTTISNEVEKKIQKSLENIIEKFKDNSKFFNLYPLAYLELGYKKDPIPENIHNLTRRGVISWFLRSTFGKVGNKTDNNIFNENEYMQFENELYPVIEKMYQDSRTLREIKDHRSINHSKIEVIDALSNTYQLKIGFVSDKYKAESFYFYGLSDKQEFEAESKKIEIHTNKFIDKYSPSSKQDIRKIKRLEVDIDINYLNDTVERVKIDFDKLSVNFSSQTIKNRDNFIKVVAFFYYLSTVRAFYYNVVSSINNIKSVRDFIVLGYEREWLINKINKTFKVDRVEIDNYIDYLTLKGEGSLFEFPIISQADEIYFIPSSIILNDWHFNIVNGHYAKNITFEHRDRTISTKFVHDLESGLRKYNNLLVSTEYYYEYFNNNEKYNSDVDLAIYDRTNNIVIIVECKWKDNHYISEGDVNYFKIEATLNEIYEKQLSKHREFVELDVRSNLNSIFKTDEFDCIHPDLEIVYIAIDKRYQLHIEDRHLLTAYQFIGMIDLLSESNQANMLAVVNDIKSLKSKTEYITTLGTKTIEIGNYKIVTDDLKWDYNLNFL